MSKDMGVVSKGSNADMDTTYQEMRRTCQINNGMTKTDIAEVSETWLRWYGVEEGKEHAVFAI
jgi:hypothetical protein